jgi:uncharacterized protein YggE
MEITKILLVGILIVAVLSLGVLITKPETKLTTIPPEYGDFKILSAGDSTESKYLLNVNGDAKLSADPEKVKVSLGAETIASTAKESQQNNADVMQEVRNSLKSIGIASKDIKTTQYSLDVVQHWDEKTGKYVIDGYRTTQIIQIESTDINKAGDIIDKAVQSGANKVNGVVFSLTDEKIKELRLEALKEAGINAKEKADAIASSLGITIKRVYQASEGYVYYQPYNVQKSYEMVAGATAAPTEISPGQIEISASVSVSYELA